MAAALKFNWLDVVPEGRREFTTVLAGASTLVGLFLLPVVYLESLINSIWFLQLTRIAYFYFKWHHYFQFMNKVLPKLYFAYLLYAVAVALPSSMDFHPFRTFRAASMAVSSLYSLFFSFWQAHQELKRLQEQEPKVVEVDRLQLMKEEIKEFQ